MHYENVRSLVPGSPVFVGFSSDFVTHIEVRWPATQLGGVREDDAHAEVETLLPADVRLQHRFAVPPKPDGPVALRAYQWESRSLYGVMPGRKAVSVFYPEETERQQNLGSASVTIVLAASITIAQARR